MLKTKQLLSRLLGSSSFSLILGCLPLWCAKGHLSVVPTGQGLLADCQVVGELGWGWKAFGAGMRVTCALTQSRPLTFWASPCCLPSDKSCDHTAHQCPPLELAAEPPPTPVPLGGTECVIYTESCARTVDPQ